MTERRISEVEVEACWNDHYTDYPDKKGNPNYIGDVQGRRIKVVVSKSNSRVIITVADQGDITMRIKYDRQADAIYIRLSDAPYAYGEDLDKERRIDYDASGKPRGVELLCVSEGVITDDLPQRSEIERLLGEHGIKIYAQAILKRHKMVKQLDVKNLETTKQDFEALLKKACEQKPKPSAKSSKTQAVRLSCDYT